MSRCVFSAGFLAAAAVAFPAWAQTSVPAAADPGKIQQQLEEKTPLPSGPSVSVAPATLPGLSEKERKQLEATRFVLRGVVVEGSTVYAPDDLKPIYEFMLGQEISLLDARTIARRITAKYRDDRYVLSRAVVPKNPVRNGVLTIHAIEGYIADVQVGGSEAPDYADTLKSKKPVRLSDIERFLLVMGDMPGTSAKGFVRPPQGDSGAGEIMVTVERKSPSAFATVDNRGTKYSGPLEYTLGAEVYNLLREYDRTLARFITTSPSKELRFVDLLHEEPIFGGSGARLLIDASYSKTDSGDSLKSSRINGDSFFAMAQVNYPFLRMRQENLFGRATFDIRNTDTDSAATNLSNDRLRVLRAGGTYQFADGWQGVNLFDAQASHGLTLFNASNTPSTLRSQGDGKANFTKFTADFTRSQPLPGSFSLVTGASGQYALDPLLVAEQYSLGGATYGRAYDPAELTGDHALAGRVEVRYSRYFGETYLNSYQPYGFYDIGRVWQRGAVDGDSSLSSAGLGMRANFTPSVWGYAEIAAPLTKNVANQGGHGDDPRVFFSLTGRF